MNAAPSSGRARGGQAEQHPSRNQIRDAAPRLLHAHRFVSVAGKPIASYELKLHHDGHSERALILAQVRRPKTAMRAAPCTRGVGRVVHTNELGRKPIVAAWRSYSTATRKIRHVRVAIAIFPTERDVLLGHVVESGRCIPGFER